MHTPSLILRAKRSTNVSSPRDRFFDHSMSKTLNYVFPFFGPSWRHLFSKGLYEIYELSLPA
jgi:hypothetical protein